MKIGLIARCDARRGLAIQSHGFYENLPVDRVLLVRMPRPVCEEKPEWFPGATEVRYNDQTHTIDEEIAREWMRGLDVVFAVETPYHWQLPNWAREMGIKTVIQGNPEFYRHGTPGHENSAQPDCWWWPTTWRLDKLPAGRVVPVPMPYRRRTAADPEQGPLSVAHVVGMLAHADRNGTEIVASAVAGIRAQVHLSMYSLEGVLPEMRRNPRVTIEGAPMGVEDRWSMYEGQHLLVLPRRYGGLCLPALEAAACGVAVLMPNCAPNHELASLFIEPRRHRSLALPCGTIQAAEVNHVDLSRQLDHLARNMDEIAAAQSASYESVLRWPVAAGMYVDELERVCNS